MTAEIDIDELLRQDEAALRSKRKRLKALATAVEEVRAAHLKASTLAAELVDAGDLTRAELGRAFGLSKAERSALLPTNRTVVSDGAVPAEPVRDLGNQPSDAVVDPERDSDN